MGVNGLMKLLKKEAPASIVEAHVSTLRGWRITVDASISVYQWRLAGRQRHIVNEAGQPINHIQGALYRTLRMLELGIVPIYVFDGAPPPEKADTIARRIEARAHDGISRSVYQETAQLLQAMGVKVVQAPSEAEAEAAYLTTTGADAIITEDMDALAFGAARMIRGFNATTETVVVIELAKVLEGLGLTRAQFIDLCILLGCDYTGTLPGIGVARALPLIKRWGSIEGIIDAMGIHAPADFDYVGARAAFLAHPVCPVESLERGRLGDLEGLLERHGLAKKKIQNAIERIQAL